MAVIDVRQFASAVAGGATRSCSKLGLRLSAAEIAALDAWISEHPASLDRPLQEAGGRI